MTTHSQGKYKQYRNNKYAPTKKQLAYIQVRGTESEHPVLSKGLKQPHTLKELITFVEDVKNYE
jgi:hypothetical protein